MKRYVIERDIPGVGQLQGRELTQAAATSNDALSRLKGRDVASTSRLSQPEVMGRASGNRRCPAARMPRTSGS